MEPSKETEGDFDGDDGRHLFGDLIRQFVEFLVFQRNVVEILDKVGHVLIGIGVLRGSNDGER